MVRCLDLLHKIINYKNVTFQKVCSVHICLCCCVFNDKTFMTDVEHFYYLCKGIKASGNLFILIILISVIFTN